MLLASFSFPNYQLQGKKPSSPSHVALGRSGCSICSSRLCSTGDLILHFSVTAPTAHPSNPAASIFSPVSNQDTHLLLTTGPHCPLDLCLCLLLAPFLHSLGGLSQGCWDLSCLQISLVLPASVSKCPQPRGLMATVFTDFLNPDPSQP